MHSFNLHKVFLSSLIQNKKWRGGGRWVGAGAEAQNIVSFHYRWSRSAVHSYGNAAFTYSGTCLSISNTPAPFQCCAAFNSSAHTPTICNIVKNNVMRGQDHMRLMLCDVKSNHIKTTILYGTVNVYV